MDQSLIMSATDGKMTKQHGPTQFQRQKQNLAYVKFNPHNEQHIIRTRLKKNVNILLFYVISEFHSHYETVLCLFSLWIPTKNAYDLEMLAAKL